MSLQSVPFQVHKWKCIYLLKENENYSKWNLNKTELELANNGYSD